MAASTAYVGVALKTSVTIMFLWVVSAFGYLFVYGDYATCFDLHARWGILVVVDFFTFLPVFGAWCAYKESSWIKATILMGAMCSLGGCISMGYILLQLYKLTPEESANDPLYYLLARRKKGDATENRREFSLKAAKIIFSTLGCLALGTLIYTVILELYPSYIKYFTSCLVANGTDSVIHIVVFSVWVAYKESSWASALRWILLLVLFRGVFICVYILRQLFHLSPHEPISHIIFNEKKRQRLAFKRSTVDGVS